MQSIYELTAISLGPLLFLQNNLFNIFSAFARKTYWNSLEKQKKIDS